MKKFLKILGIAGSITAAGLIATHRGSGPSTPPLDHTAAWTQACTDIFAQELERPITPAESSTCVAKARAGAQDGDLRNWVRDTDEYRALQAKKAQPPAPPAPPACGKLALGADREFHCAVDGRIWRQRYATGFPLLELLAHGRDAQADAFLDWAKGEGLNGVRVLSMIAITAQLTPDEGASAFPALAAKLQARGMGLEIVALADTGSYPGLDLGGQVQRVCAEARSVDQPVTVETANEPYHPTQSDAVHDYSNLPKWSHGCGVPVAYGAGEQDYGAEPQGDYVTRHLDRGRDLWNRVRRVKDLGDLASSLKKLVSDNEPIGADETDQPGKRSAQPQEFFAQGVLDRFFGLASTFHCTDCIGAKVPGSVQRQCAAAYIAGATLVPDDASFQYLNDHYGVTDGADWSKVIKVYSFVGATKSYTVLIGLTGDPAVKWVNGWHPVGVVAERPGIQVVEIQR